MKVEQAWTLKHPGKGGFNLNYTAYYKYLLIRKIEKSYNEKWGEIRKRGFKVIKITCKELPE